MTEHEQMMTAVLNCRRVDLYTAPKELSTDQREAIETMKTRRQDGEPLQYIIGDCPFINCRIKVDKRVLIPRPETEIMVEKAIETLKNISQKTINILDLGTGSGNIAIALAKNLVQSRIVSVDISQDALDLAYQNARMNFVHDKILFLKADMKQVLDSERFPFKDFDCIISNPPYIATDLIPALSAEVQSEPHTALDGGEDGLGFIRSIINNAHKKLVNNGYLFIEIGDSQSEAVENMIHSLNKYQSIEFINDYTLTKRIVSASLWKN